MAEEEVGLAGEHLGGAPAQLLYIVHHMPPAVLFTQVDHGAALNDGLTVSQMVVCHHHKAVAAQVLGKGCVPTAVFRHAVGDLDDAHDGAVHRSPLVDVDQRLLIAGGEKKFGYNSHKQRLPNLLK